MSAPRTASGPGSLLLAAQAAATGIRLIAGASCCSKSRWLTLEQGVYLSYTDKSHTAPLQNTMRTPPPPPPPLPENYGRSQSQDPLPPTSSTKTSITKDEEAIIMFLERFRDRPVKESEINYFGNNQGWAEVLKVDPWTLTRKFEETGLIRLLSAENDTERMLSAFQTVASLKEALGKLGHKKSGNKIELVTRLAEFSKDEAIKLIPQESCWATTPKGAELVDDYRSQKKAHREELEDRAFELVLNKMHKQVSRLIADYNSKQVFPPGLGCSWTDWDTTRDVNILKTIRELTPNILAGKSAKDLEPARIAASLDYLFGSRITPRLNRIMLAHLGISSDEEKQRLGLDARNLLHYAYGKTNLEEWKKKSILYAKISGCGDDSCQACQVISQKKFPISKIPQLPYEKCAASSGCRCCYIPA